MMAAARSTASMLAQLAFVGVMLLTIVTVYAVVNPDQPREIVAPVAGKAGR